MTIFGYRIETRFWIFLGIVVALIVAWMAFNSFTEEPNPLDTPAFDLTKLEAASQQDDWIDPYVEAFGVRTATGVSDFKQVSANRGQPFRAQLLIPDIVTASEQRPDLLKRNKGWTLIPAIYLDPTEPITTEAIEQRLGALAAEEVISVAFQSSQSVVGDSSGIYEITGLLYGHSQMLEAEGFVPLVLASSARPLSLNEFAKPATYIASLNVSYLKDRVQTNVKSIEWASGQELRVCLEYENRTALPLSPSSSMTATYPLAPEGAVADNLSTGFSESSALATTDIVSGSKGAGFALFPAPFAAPDRPVVLRLPSQGQGRAAVLTVEPEQFESVETAAAASGGQVVGGCA